MKKIISSLLLFLGLNSFAQQAVADLYTDWITVYQEEDGPVKKVEIAFSLGKCDNDGFMVGYSYYKIRNDFNREKETLTFKFDFTRCDETPDTESVSVNMAKTGEQKAPEMWFRGKTIKGNPYEVKLLNYNKAKAGSVSNISSFDPMAENPGLTALIKNGDLAMEQNSLIDALKFYTDAKSMGGGGDVDQKIRLAEQKLQSNAVAKQGQSAVINQKTVTAVPSEQSEKSSKSQSVLPVQESNENKKTPDFQDILANYLNAKQDYFNNREKTGGNTKDTYYLNCQLNYILKANYSKTCDAACKCDYQDDSPEFKSSPETATGKIDSVNYYYSTENFRKGLGIIRGKRHENLFFAGDVMSRLSDLYALSLYTSRYDTFGLKEQEKFKKEVLQNKLVSHEILKASVTAFLKEKDFGFAKYGFQYIITNDTDAYFKKIAYLFMAVMNNYEDKVSGKHNSETPEMLKRAMQINKSNFLKIENTYYSNSTFGLYIYPEYYDMLQMAIIEETAEYYYNQTGLTNQEYAIPYQYFYDYFNSTKG